MGLQKFVPFQFSSVHCKNICQKTFSKMFDKVGSMPLRKTYSGFRKRTLLPLSLNNNAIKDKGHIILDDAVIMNNDLTSRLRRLHIIYGF